MFTVEKIGGTSMSNFDQVLQNIIQKPSNASGRIFVVSAYSGITNLLLEHKKSGVPGVYSLFAEGKEYTTLLNQVCFKMQEINHSLQKNGLNRQLADEYIRFRVSSVRKHLNGMSDLISAGYTDPKFVLHSARELLASLGEVHSAFNSFQILRNRGIIVNFADLSGFGDIDSLTINQRILKTFIDFDYKNTLTVATGFTRGTEYIMKSFDRGYSEVTFSRIAALLKADEAIIHKEFHLSSADPLIVGQEKAKPVCNTSYEIAGHLANIGMEAIHPDCAKILEESGIDLIIKNTFDPHHSGTLINNQYNANNSGVKIIAGSDKMLWLDINDFSGLATNQLDTLFSELFNKYNIKLILKTANANNVSAIIPEKELTEEVKMDLTKTFTNYNLKKIAMLNILGNNLNSADFLAHTAAVLRMNNITIDYLSISLRRINLQLIINRDDLNKAIQILHKTFCENDIHQLSQCKSES